MKNLFVFGMGFASGWTARANADSLRALAVALVAAGYEGAERLRVVLATEREALEDLFAEGRAYYEARRRGGATIRQEGATGERRIRAA